MIANWSPVDIVVNQLKASPWALLVFNLIVVVLAAVVPLKFMKVDEGAVLLLKLPKFHIKPVPELPVVP